MERRRLDIWMDGTPEPAGTLIARDDDALTFAYAESYLQQSGAPLSLALPLQPEPFGDLQSRAFFGNLLPENNQIERVRDREGLDANDVAGILFHLGADCPGAISCLPAGSPPAKVPGELAGDYLPLSQDEIDQIVVNLADNKRLPDVARDPSPLAGVQGKIAITILPDGRWALPRADVKAPTTHILKVPPRDEGMDAKLEAAACGLASAVGFDASNSKAITIADRSVLLIERFDRRVKEGMVYRIHQEDFTQALGLPRSLKYERNGQDGRRFDARAVAGLLDRTAQPARARELFLTGTVFHLVVGNNDNHGKNHGLLYRNGPVPDLAPLYDILPVRLSDRYTHQLAFNIGAAGYADDITAGDLETFFAEFGLTGARYGRFVRRAVAGLLSRIEASSSNLSDQGVKALDDFIGNELERLSESFGLDLKFRERDYFASRGGGWSAS